uniref:Uncharacterized protein n=1 Tax=Arundo donax TaxID=35708 RepID=A0A0A9D762_ARUDO
MRSSGAEVASLSLVDSRSSIVLFLLKLWHNDCSCISSDFLVMLIVSHEEPEPGVAHSFWYLDLCKGRQTSLL